MHKRARFKYIEVGTGRENANPKTRIDEHEDDDLSEKNQGEKESRRTEDEKQSCRTEGEKQPHRTVINCISLAMA